MADRQEGDAASDLRLLLDGIREEVEHQILSMGREGTLVGHASVGGVSLVVLDMEPISTGGGRTMRERRWVVIVEEPQHSGNRTQTASGIVSTEWDTDAS